MCWARALHCNQADLYYLIELIANIFRNLIRYKTEFLLNGVTSVANVLWP